MYIEISGAQSGKTTRLLAAMKEYLERDLENRAIFQDKLGAIARRKALALGPELLSRVIPISDVFMGSLVGNNLEKARLFVDDFDNISHDKLEILPDGYYATTPAFIREEKPDESDFLYRLLMAAGHEYKNYLPVIDARPLIRCLAAADIPRVVYGIWHNRGEG